MSLATINDGARHLLTESCRLLDQDLQEVLVVGGWGTFLRNQDCHPGTRDVDILFPPAYDREKMKQVMLRFLNDDFLVSAKHDFQIMKAIEVGERRYLYNVDFLHPTVDKKDIIEFQDIVQFDETIDGHVVKKAQSIGIKGGQLLFEENMMEQISVDNHQPKVLDGTGIIISKISACMNPKRRRDIYDMTLEWQRSGSAIRSSLTHLALEYVQVTDWLKRVVEFSRDRPMYFAECVRENAEPYGNATEAAEVLQSMLDAFTEICADA